MGEVIRKHRWGLYFAIEDYGRPKPKRGDYDGIDVSLLKDIRPGRSSRLASLGYTSL